MPQAVVGVKATEMNGEMQFSGEGRRQTPQQAASVTNTANNFGKPVIVLVHGLPKRPRQTSWQRGAELH